MGIQKRVSRAEATAANDRRLAEAARAVFLRRGYHAATLDEVAQAAGLTKGAVYARHASKAELFLSLLEARVAQRAAEIRGLPPARGADGVDAVFLQWIEGSRRDAAWSLLVVEFRVAAARDRAINARYAAIHERVIDAVAERIGDAPLALSARDTARLGLALANGILLERAAVGDAVPDAAAVLANAALFEGLLRRKRRGAS